MKIEVISLGGSLIIPSSSDKIDFHFLKSFKKLITSFKDRKFIIVTGGGSTARKYMRSLEKGGANKKHLCLMGINLTRLHARFLAYFFKKEIHRTVTQSIKNLERLLSRERIVFTGGLRYEEDNTSDGTAAKIAKHFKTEFINITDVKGLYDKDPRKFKNAKLIKNINFKDFKKIMSKIKFKPGQHFILDQNAAKIINKHKVKTIIVGKDLNNLKRFLKGNKFIGTTVN